jgi:asparaginyl-tRNA synthetase
MRISKLTQEYTGSIRGHIHVIRSQKKFTFIDLRDGPLDADRVQVIIPSQLVTSDLMTEAYIELSGKCSPLPEKATSFHSFEFHASSVTIVGKSDSDYSTRCPSTSGPDVKITERHLHLRDREFALVTLLRAYILKAMRSAFEDMDCTEITPPSFVGVECEGGATLFKLKHPGASGETDVFLTQSSQFYLEMALPALGDTYCIAQSFRAEKSHTRRHLTEFTHAETEWKDIQTIEDHCQKLKTMMHLILLYFKDYSEKALIDYSKIRGVDLCQRVKSLLAMTDDIMILKHSEAIEMCRKYDIYKDEDTKTHFDKDDDIPEAAERKLIDKIGKIVFLTHFPMATKSFYMKADPADPTLALGVDVEVPGVGEIVGSGIREADIEVLKQRMKAQGLKEDDYKEYLDLRRYGFSQTSGMGLGVDRMLCWILDLFTIRQSVTFPRYPGCIRP